MPIFEYRCKQCGHVTSFLEKAGRGRNHVCEKCGSKATEKLLSTFAANTKSNSGSSNSSCPTGTCPLT
jgi:putative FmdB family regulatory protein